MKWSKSTCVITTKSQDCVLPQLPLTACEADCWACDVQLTECDSLFPKKGSNRHPKSLSETKQERPNGGTESSTCGREVTVCESSLLHWSHSLPRSTLCSLAMLGTRLWMQSRCLCHQERPVVWTMCWALNSMCFQLLLSSSTAFPVLTRSWLSRAGSSFLPGLTKHLV